jgi:4-amino-4-deoxy-L-arabinose transferase-like glycosyltransferase
MSSADGVKSRLAALALVTSVLFFLSSAVGTIRYNPMPWPDEALFADVSRQLILHGKLALPALQGLLPGLDQRMYLMPPVYFLSVALMFLSFGVSQVAMRALSLVTALLILLVMTRISPRHKSSPILMVVPSILLCFDCVFMRGATIGRMEMLAMLFSLSALALFESLRQSSSLRRAAACGLLAGLAGLTHPIGAVAAVAIGLGFLIERRPLKEFGLYLLAGGLCLAAWGIYILIDIPAFKGQFGAQLSRKVRMQAGLQKILTDYAYWYRPLKWQVWLYWGVGTLGVVVGTIRGTVSRTFLIYQLLLSVLVLNFYEQWYGIWLLPGMALGFASLFQAVLDLRTKVAYAAGALVGLVVGLFSVPNAVAMVRKQLDTAASDGVRNTLAWAESIRQSLPPNSRVLVAAIPDPYFTLVGRDDIQVLEFLPKAIFVESDVYRKFVNSADYVVIGGFIVSWSLLNYVEQHGEKLSGVALPGTEQRPLLLYRLKK